MAIYSLLSSDEGFCIYVYKSMRGWFIMYWIYIKKEPRFFATHNCIQYIHGGMFMCVCVCVYTKHFFMYIFKSYLKVFIKNWLYNFLLNSLLLGVEKTMEGEGNRGGGRGTVVCIFDLKLMIGAKKNTRAGHKELCKKCVIMNRMMGARRGHDLHGF